MQQAFSESIRYLKIKKFFKRLDTVFGIAQLVVAIIFGVVAAYLLGSVFGLEAKGYAGGFILGVGLSYGAISLG